MQRIPSVRFTTVAIERISASELNATITFRNKNGNLVTGAFVTVHCLVNGFYCDATNDICETGVITVPFANSGDTPVTYQIYVPCADGLVKSEEWTVDGGPAEPLLPPPPDDQ